MFAISAELTGMILGVAFVLVAATVPFGKLIGKMSRRYQDALGEAQTASTEALGSIRTVRAFVAEEAEVERYAPLRVPVIAKSHRHTVIRMHKC
jgi:ABC-type multidrug transport system fused ATPase/permease subunit